MDPSRTPSSHKQRHIEYPPLYPDKGCSARMTRELGPIPALATCVADPPRAVG